MSSVLCEMNLCEMILCQILLIPLEASDNRVLDFIQVLDSLGAVNHDVRTIGVGAEAPDLSEYYFNLNKCLNTLKGK